MDSNKIFMKIAVLFVWLGGICILAIKGWQHVRILINNGTEIGMMVLGLAIALILGAIVGTRFFRPVCRQNLQRIDELENPPLWRAFQHLFFAYLALIMIAGILLSHLARLHGEAQFFMMVFDLFIAVCLLVSSVEFIFNIKPEEPKS